MGTNTLTDRVSGTTIEASHPNEIHQAINTDFVGRNSSGVPTANQNLGTAAFPWGTVRAGSLVIGGSSVDTSQVAAPPFRVVSGATRATSNQPAFLDPAGSGSGASFTLTAASTSLLFDVNGTSFTLSSDIVKGSLTVAPSSNNTCLVDDTDAADQASTRTWGEPDGEKTSITIDTAGTEITGKIGQYAAFQHGNEYFTAFIKSATELTDCRRGFFYDDALAPVNREVFSNNDTITLLSLGYVFLDSDLATVDVTYTQPVVSFTAPSSPATGDYWYDLGNNLQKRYDGATFQSVSRTFIGWVCLNTADAIGCRSVDFDKRFKRDNTLKIDKDTSEIAKVRQQFGKVSVVGIELNYQESRPQWNITTDLATSADMYSATEQASTFYYLYVSDEGEEIMSDIEPYRRPDLQGWYHPHNPWRCVGSAFNDSGSDIQFATESFEMQENYTVYSSDAGQSFSSGGGLSNVDFEDLEYESHTSLVVTGASWVWTCPVTGFYEVSAGLHWAAQTWNASGNIQSAIELDGSTLKTNPEDAWSATSNVNASRPINASIRVVQGQTVNIACSHSAGGSKTLEPNNAGVWVSITKLERAL